MEIIVAEPEPVSIHHTDGKLETDGRGRQGLINQRATLRPARSRASQLCTLSNASRQDRQGRKEKFPNPVFQVPSAADRSKCLPI